MNQPRSTTENNGSQKNNTIQNSDKLNTGWMIIISFFAGVFVSTQFFNYIIRGVFIDKIFINNSTTNYQNISVFLLSVLPLITAVGFILLIFFILRKINKKLTSSVAITIIKFIPLIIIQLAISAIIGHMSYCGIEGTCESPSGLAYLLFTANIFIDLLIFLYLAIKNKFSTLVKIIICILLAVGVFFIVYNSIETKKDNEKLQKQRDDWFKGSGEDITSTSSPSAASSNTAQPLSLDAYDMKNLTDYQKQTGYTPAIALGTVVSFSPSEVIILETSSQKTLTFKKTDSAIITDGIKPTDLVVGKIVQTEYEGFNPSNALRIWVK
ncbi:MAG: hypothetical protein WCV58_00050 [Patescibacteria group bacterium]